MDVLVKTRRPFSIDFEISLKNIQFHEKLVDIDVKFGEKRPGQEEQPSLNGSISYLKEKVPKDKVIRKEISGLKPVTFYKFIFTAMLFGKPHRYVLLTSTRSSSTEEERLIKTAGTSFLARSSNGNKSGVAEGKLAFSVKEEETKQSKSEKVIIQSLLENRGVAGILGGKNGITKSIMQARKSKNAESYSKSGFKFSRPPHLRQERMARTLIVSSAKEATFTLTSGEKGKEFLKNDWFMGPFYAWDNNVEEGTRENLEDN